MLQKKYINSKIYKNKIKHDNKIYSILVNKTYSVLVNKIVKLILNNLKLNHKP